jgi:transcriptional regulator with XRE-family HTH domain
MSIREIARRTGLSRNTVKKYLRMGEETPRYAKRTSSSKFDPYAGNLTTWLAIEATKSRKQRRNLRQIHTAVAGREEAFAVSRLGAGRKRSAHSALIVVPQDDYSALCRRDIVSGH